MLLNCVQIRAKNLETDEEFKSNINKWCSRVHDDRATMREFPIDRLPIVKYNVAVHTGKDAGSETKSNVYLTMFGTRGDSGKRELILSNNNAKFRAGQIDVFEVEAVHLGEIQHLAVSHDNSAGGWFLDKVVVKELRNASEEITFVCGQWLDAARGDGLTERLLYRPGR
jgi:hypothetical protein